MFRKLGLAMMLVLACTMTTSCMGRFALSGKVREFNLYATEHRWGREALFFAMYVIPVYPIAGCIDMVIVNSIEFWSGRNPISGETPPLVDVEFRTLFEDE